MKQSSPAAQSTAAPSLVTVIGGGATSEHTVSLASAAAVRSALESRGYDVQSVTITESGLWQDGAGHQISPHVAVGFLAASDVVFPVLHGENGEDGMIAGLLTAIGVPYVGSPVRGSAIAHDKSLTKMVAAELGIPTANAVTWRARTGQDRPRVARYPVVVKPATAGSSLGVSVVEAEDELAAAIDLAAEFAEFVLIEEFIRGKEVDVAILDTPSGRQIIGAPLEILVRDGDIFSATGKYDGSARFRIPASITERQRQTVNDYAMRLHGELGCSGVARFDFFVTHDSVVLNEINTCPGMSERSQVPQIFAGIGIDYPLVVDLLVRHAVKKGTAPAAIRRVHTGAVSAASIEEE